MGVPSRRSFLTVGGATVLGSAVLVGCGKSSKKTLAVSGTSIPEPSSTTTTAPGTKELDLTLLRTAQSIEVLAIQTYQTALDSNLLTTAGLADMIKLFQSQHTDHSGLLASATSRRGGHAVRHGQPVPGRRGHRPGAGRGHRRGVDREDRGHAREHRGPDLRAGRRGAHHRRPAGGDHEHRRHRGPPPLRALRRAGGQPGAAAHHAHPRTRLQRTPTSGPTAR